MTDNNNGKQKISVTKNGPYIVTGRVPLVKGSTNEAFPAQETYALCRCGKSKKKPFCDGSHIKEKFNDEE